MEKTDGVYVLFQHEESAICDCGGLPYISAIWLEAGVAGELHLLVEEKCFDCEGYLDLTDYSLSEIDLKSQEE